MDLEKIDLIFGLGKNMDLIFGLGKKYGPDFWTL